MTHRKAAGIAFLLFSYLALVLPQLFSQAQDYPPEMGHHMNRSEEQAMSELNHRIAGGCLIAIGLAALVGNRSERFAALQKVWPFFFIMPGVLLIFFSDAEVWPMGPQSWLYMARHNLQAVQHKLAAVVMILIGSLEFQRARGKLRPFVATWGFPVMAVLGASILFIHPHIVAAGDAPPPVAAAQPASAASADAVHAEHHHEAAAPAGAPAKKVAGPHEDMDHAAMDHEAGPAKRTEHDAHAEHPAAATAAASAPATMQAAPEHAGHQGGSHDQHTEHEKVRIQHLYFSLTGFAIALTKLLYDGRFWKTGLASAAWPSLLCVLGALLVFYGE